MGRNRWSAYQTQTRLTQIALQEQAVEKTGHLKHTLGLWSAAKRKKHGTDAMMALCTQCGKPVFIMPRHWHSLKLQQVPAMKGEALFELCYLDGVVK